ncbi:MAG: hypothetical protein WBZ36_23710 [Candidatus Nitrosopolaris sp.]
MTYIATKAAVININNAYRTYTFHPTRMSIYDGLTGAVNHHSSSQYIG